MVTVCGGAAPRGAPVRLWNLLAPQCPRLRRLSGSPPHASDRVRWPLRGPPYVLAPFHAEHVEQASEASLDTDPLVRLPNGSPGWPRAQTAPGDANALRMRSITAVGFWKSSRQVKWIIL